MSARRDTFNFSNRRDGERSRDRDRERDPFDRDRGTDRDDRDRNFNTARYRDHSPVPRSMGSSPPYASRSRDNRPGPAATIGTTKSSSGDQQRKYSQVPSYFMTRHRREDAHMNNRKPFGGVRRKAPGRCIVSGPWSAGETCAAAQRVLRRRHAPENHYSRARRVLAGQI